MSKLSHSERIEFIKNLFDAEPEIHWPDDDLLSFLDSRSELEKDPDIQTLEGYTRHYETLRTYALDEKIMKELEFLIKWNLQFWPESFYSTEFYRKFKQHHVVRKAIDDYIHNFNMI